MDETREEVRVKLYMLLLFVVYSCSASGDTFVVGKDCSFFLTELILFYFVAANVGMSRIRI